MKLFDFPGGAPGGMPDFVKYVGGSIELVGGVLVMIGLFTRWSAFVCSGMMAAAYWMAHGTNALLPVVNKGELAVVYCFVFLYIASNGPGILSVDSKR
jgi:putative oxidoreductase